MRGTLRSVAVQSYGLWDADNPRYGEFVRLAEPENGDHNVRWSLDKAINGDRPEVGELVDVEYVVRFKAKARTRRDGSTYAILDPSYRVVGFTPALAPAA